jgi:hypothetical protein
MLFTLSIKYKCDTSTIQLEKIVTKKCYYRGVPVVVAVEKQIGVPLSRHQQHSSQLRQGKTPQKKEMKKSVITILLV